VTEVYGPCRVITEFSRAILLQ